MKGGYELLDSGAERKLERFGDWLLDRPAPQALWRPARPAQWARAHGRFERRSDGDGDWTWREKPPERWELEVADLHLLVGPTPFGHLGIFPEQIPHWDDMRREVGRATRAGREVEALNLFAYTGGATLACAVAGARVVHLDASRPVVLWARENAMRSLSPGAEIAWLVEDAMKFLRREKRRGRRYDAVVLDPPSFGRGPDKEVFKLERDLAELLDLAAGLLADDAIFLHLSCHTPGVTPAVLCNLLGEALDERGGAVQSGEMLAGLETNMPLPSGCFACWRAEAPEPEPGP